jgi:hypothetical protein
VETLWLAEPRIRSGEARAFTLRTTSAVLEVIGGAFLGSFTGAAILDASSGHWNNTGTYVSGSIAATGVLAIAVAFILSAESARLAGRSRTTYNDIANETKERPVHSDTPAQTGAADQEGFPGRAGLGP